MHTTAKNLKHQWPLMFKYKDSVAGQVFGLPKAEARMFSTPSFPQDGVTIEECKERPDIVAAAFTFHQPDEVKEALTPLYGKVHDVK